MGENGKSLRRCTVGVIIFNKEGHMLVGQRSKRKRKGIGQWQFIQGGVNDGEDLKVAAYREVYEEVGLHAES